MYGFWYYYVKLKYIKTNNIFKDIAKDAENRFDATNYELGRPLPPLIKNELGGKIMAKFVEFRKKTYSYLIDNGSKDKKAKNTKKCVIKRKIKFENYKDCLEATQIQKNVNLLEKNKCDRDSLKWS